MELLRVLALLAGGVGLLRQDVNADVKEKDADVDGVAQGRHHHHRECNHH